MDSNTCSGFFGKKLAEMVRYRRSKAMRLGEEVDLKWEISS